MIDIYHARHLVHKDFRKLLNNNNNKTIRIFWIVFDRVKMVYCVFMNYELHQRTIKLYVNVRKTNFLMLLHTSLLRMRSS